MAQDENRNLSEEHPQPELGSRVRLAPGLHLTAEQIALLDKAMPAGREILVKQEFRSGYSGAVVMLVSVGAGRAPLVVKLAHPHDLRREYDAYEEYVRQVSPQNIAHLQGEPLESDDGTLGLLQYTFAGGESHLPTTSLQSFFETAGAAKTSEVVNRIFRVFGRHWWADNRAASYVLDEYYDRLLPVHLRAEETEAGAEADYTIRAGVSSVLIATEIQHGQTIHLVGFEVMKSRNEGRRLTLLAPPPPNQAAAPLRVRVELKDPSDYSPGDVVDSLFAIVTDTRQSLLGDAAAEALPGFEPTNSILTLPPDRQNGTAISLPNPLVGLEDRLYGVVETNMSIIHGDLNMQNILVDAPTGFAWLIDFAETRVGPTLLDLQRLEAQVYTKLMAEYDFPLSTIAEIITRLHADPPQPPPAVDTIQEAYSLLVTIRRLVRQYLIDDLDWNEYYYGLSIVLIGALKYDELDERTRARSLVAAAAAEQMIGRPLGAATNGLGEVPPEKIRTGTTATAQGQKEGGRSRGVWVGVSLAAVIVLLLGLVAFQMMRPTAVAPQTPGTPNSSAVVSTEQAGGVSTDAASTHVEDSDASSGTVSANQQAVGAAAAADEVQAGEGENESDGSGKPATVIASEEDTSAVADESSSESRDEASSTAESNTESSATPTEETPAQQAAPILNPQAGDTRVNEIDSAVYTFIPGGTFTMGADGQRADEGPAHTVELDAFWLMRNEVTNEQYAKCVAAGVCSSPASSGWDDPERALFPVAGVTWDQAAEYAQWAGGRLPTEAEWEMAARSNDERLYPWGNDSPNSNLANFNFAAGGTTITGSHPDGAGPFGNLDMAGNVEEWVADRYEPGYYSASPTRNPLGPEEGPLRSVRGGSYFSNGMGVRTYAREKALPNANFDSVGFRVAMSVD